MMRVSILPLVLLITSSVLAEAAPRRSLNLRKASRAIDLAWQAELAGDYKGARVALQQLVNTATRSEELAAKDRINEWLQTMSLRESAFKTHGRKSSRGYREAHQTLRGFGLRRSTLLWRKALGDVPALERMTKETVRVRAEWLKGIEKEEPILEHVRTFLERHGIQAKEKRGTRFDVRINMDATDLEETGRGVRVRVEASMVLRDRSRSNNQGPVGSVAKRRAEFRRRESRARDIATKRVLDDASGDLVFLLRSHFLGEASASEEKRSAQRP